MLFNSLRFLAFFPAVTALYFLLPHRWRWLLLLIASYAFYMLWRPEYAVILLFITIVGYLAALLIERSRSGLHKKIWLLTAVLITIGLLAFFKYAGFFSETVNQLMSFYGLGAPLSVPAILLPVGISFYTFQTLGYVIDVYRGQQKAERHFGYFALFVSFFPLLLAGPIERAGHLLIQLKQKTVFSGERLQSGALIFSWGLFKKIVIADQAALLADYAYSNPEASGLTLLIGTYAFALQIYGDFSGYSDMAVGCARILGIDVVKNFDSPYAARSLSDFWRRWHISLTSWFRDYIYISLGGNRRGLIREICNLLIVFLISGLWHGAAWTFVVWGLLHGTALAVLRLCKRFDIRLSLPAPLGILLTFHFVTFTWIFFRASSLTHAMFVLKKITTRTTFSFDAVRTTLIESGLYVSGLAGLVVAVLIMEAVQWRLRRAPDAKPRPVWLAIGAQYGLALLILALGAFKAHPFIYLQF